MHQQLPNGQRAQRPKGQGGRGTAMDLRTRKARVSGRLVVSGRVGRHVSRHQGDCKNEWLHKESAWVGVRERGACGRWQTALALEGRVDVEHCEMTLGGGGDTIGASGRRSQTACNSRRREGACRTHGECGVHVSAVGTGHLAEAKHSYPCPRPSFPRVEERQGRTVWNMINEPQCNSSPPTSAGLVPLHPVGVQYAA